MIFCAASRCRSFARRGRRQLGLFDRRCAEGGLDAQGRFRPQRRHRIGSSRGQGRLAPPDRRAFEVALVVEIDASRFGRVGRVDFVLVETRLDTALRTGFGAQLRLLEVEVDVAIHTNVDIDVDRRDRRLGLEALGAAREDGGTPRGLGLAPPLPAGARAPQVQAGDEQRPGDEQDPAQFVHRVAGFLA